MLYNDDDLLQLSGLQHFLFCRRQWALIHIEQQWAENLRTVGGELMHDRAHDSGAAESRGDVYVVRGMRIVSPTLGVSGACDVVEFRRCDDGISLPHKRGLWSVYPVEYKHGEPKPDNCDAAQLCGQAMCLEEMLCCEIPRGALFYGTTRRRLEIEFTDDLRKQVRDALSEMHRLYARGYTPKVKPSKACNACSLKELCLPVLCKNRSVASYLASAMEEKV